MKKIFLILFGLHLYLCHFPSKGDNLVILHCGTPGSPAHGRVNFLQDTINIGTTATYECDVGFELIGSPSRVCLEDGTWSGMMPFCVIDIALNKPTESSSTDSSYSPSKANDGNLSNKRNGNDCFQTKLELSPWWKTNLLKSYEIIGIKITSKECCDNDLHDIEVRIGNSSNISENRLCYWHPKGIESGISQDFLCAHPIVGQYVTIQMAGVEGILTFCEVSIFTNSEMSPSYCYQDSSMPIVRSFDNNCYEFQYQGGKSADDAEKYCKNHTGSLVGPIDAAKQAFLEAEISRMALPKSIMFWIGLKKDSLNSWKWLNGSPLVENFWTMGQPNNADGQQACVALESEGNWRWNDVRCNINYLRLICEYKPYTCSAPDVPSNATITQTDFTIGKKVLYRCNKGNKLIGTTERVCQKSGIWSNKVPICKFIDCGILTSISNGQIVLADNTTYYRSRADYECQPHHRLVGKKSRVCLESGKWSGEEPVCMGTECKELKNIENGNLTLIKGNFGFGSVVEYNCHENYFLTGDSRRTCLENGSWDGNQPLCQEKVCLQPETPPYSHVNVSGYLVGSVAQYSCQTGHQLHGKSDRICQDNHDWSDKPPTCPLINCGFPPIIYYGNFILEGNSTEYGNAIKYFCEGGYRLEGQITRICLENGSWSQEAPICRVKECEELKASEHQFIKQDSQTVGSKVTYSCDQGYALIGIKERICLKNGKWSDEFPVCKSIECDYPEIPKNCSISLSHNPPKYKSIATYSCDKGFTMSGLPVRICEENVRWSGIEPNCTEIECPSLNTIDNGFVSLSQIPPIYNSTATYFCNDSYNLIGPHKRQCRGNGTWSEMEPKCISYQCEIPKSIPNGVVQILQVPPIYKTLVYYDCLENYILVGPYIRMCNENGTWNNSEPICISSRCSLLPEIANGRIIASTYEINVSLIEYACNSGYKLEGDAVIICQNNGQWNKQPPVCKAKQCEMPSVLNGYIKISQTPPVYNTIAEYMCAEGYILYGSSIRVCLETSIWSEEEPHCKIVNCGEPKIPANSILVSNATVFGSSVKYKCEIGYELLGYDIRFCLENGTWSGENPTCIAVDCGQPKHLPHSTFVPLTSNSTIYGSSVLYTCEFGYEMMGEAVSYCLGNGSWSGKDSLCIEKPCTLPEKDNHMIIASDQLTVGSQVNYSCVIGYNLVGVNIRTCFIGGNWDASQPTCEPVECGYPSQIENGKIVYQNGTTYQSVVEYACEQKYKLEGQRYSNCGENGKWSENFQKCVELPIETCSEPPLHTNMKVSGNNYTINSTIEYSCNTGYILYGISKRICLITKNWSGIIPECHPVDCGIPLDPINGYSILNNKTTTFGSHLQYGCRDSYILIGIMWSSCMEDGKWDGPQPKCLLLDALNSVPDNPVLNEITLMGTLTNNLPENYINDENTFHAESESGFLEKPVQRKYNLQLGLGVGFSIAFLLMMGVGVLILFIIKAKRKLVRNRQAVPMQVLNKDKPVLFFQLQKPQPIDTAA